MRLVRFAISNPYGIAVASLFIVIFGAVCLTRLPKDMLPVFKAPAVQVLTFYPGMPAEIVEKDITTRLERWTGQSNGIARQESKSIIGVSIVKDFFRPDIDPNTAMSQVTSLAMSDLYYLPPGTIPPMVMPFDPTASIPLALLTVEHAEMNETQLYDVAYYSLRNMLQGISGVIAPAVYGGTLRRIYAYVDPRKLADKNLSPMDVAEALRNSNVMIPTGNAKFGDKDYQIVTNAMVERVEEMNDFLIRGEMGVPVFVGDVARVEDTHQIQTNIVRVNGKRQVYIPVYRQPGANTIQVVDGIRSALKGILERLPKGMKLDIVGDQSVFVRSAIRSLASEVVLGGLLAVLMVLFFLRSWRASLGVVLALPLSIFAAFIGLWSTGEAINAMTLGGLALAVGILIDNSIVVLENVTRHMETGATGRDAALNAASEVSLPVLAATTTLVIVFLPVTFLTGIGKFLFTSLALSVVFSILASYVLSMTLVPCFCSLFLKAEAHAKERWFRRVVSAYDTALRFCLTHKIPVLATVFIFFLGSLALYPLLGKELFPRSDVGHLNVQLRLPTGTSVDATEKLITDVERRLPEVIEPSVLKTVISNMGVLYDWPAAYTPNSGPQDAFLEIELSENRKHSSFEYAQRLREFLAAHYPQVEAAVETGGLLTAALNEGQPAPINIQVQGNDLRTSSGLAREVVQRAKSVPGTVDVRIQERLDYPQVYVRIDRKKVAALGLTVQEVVKNVVTAFNSSVNFAPAFWIDEKSGNHYFLGAQYPEGLIKDLETLKNIPITGRNQNRVVRLREIASIEEQQAPSEVRHVNIRRTMNVFANVHGRDIGSVAGEIEEKIKSIQVPEGYAIQIRGEVAAMRESFKNLRFGLILAVVLVYLVLVAQFRSFLDPLLILCSVPLGFMGVLLLLWLTGTRVNIQSFIGVIFMVGIAVANGILLIDFANRLWRKGAPADEAIIHAGLLRLRPIVMTALAAMLGLLPMAIGIGHGAEANVPLARAVLGGLSVSTFLTLLVVPILYALLKGRQKPPAMDPEAPAEELSRQRLSSNGSTRIGLMVGLSATVTLVWVLLFAAKKIQAAEPPVLTYAQAVDWAMKNNPTLQAAAAKVREAEQDVRIAHAPAWPRLTLSAMNSDGFGGSSSAIGISGLVNSPYRKGPAVGVDTAWNVYDFGRTSYRTAAARERVGEAQARLDATRLLVRLRLAEAFFRCAGHQELLMISSEQLADQEEIVKEMSRYVRAGLRSPVEWHLLEATSEAIRVRQQDVKMRKVLALEEVLEIIGKPGSEGFQCDADAVALDSATLQGFAPKELLARHPEVQAARQALEAAQSEQKAAARENFPILSAVGSGGLLSKAPLVEKREWSAGIGVRVPLFEGFRISAAETKTDHQYQEFKDRFSAAEGVAERAVRSAMVQAIGFREKRRHLEEQHLLIQKAYRLARRRYLDKTGPFSDLRDAQNAFFQVSEQAITVRFDERLAFERLRILSGS